MIYKNLAEILINTDAKLIYDIIVKSIDRELERRTRQGGEWSSLSTGVNMGRCAGHTVAAAMLTKKYHEEGRKVYYMGYSLRFAKEFSAIYRNLFNEKCPAIETAPRSVLNYEYYRGHNISGAVIILDDTMRYGYDIVKFIRDRERMPVCDAPIIIQLGNN